MAARKPGSVADDARMVPQTLRLVWRELILGLLVYVSVVPGHPVRPFLGLLIAACAAMWSTTDGLLTRPATRIPSRILIETMLLTGCAVLIARLLHAAFGPMPIG
jgi:ABC-type enterochelin transport system permease subunit